MPRNPSPHSVQSTESLDSLQQGREEYNKQSQESDGSLVNETPAGIPLAPEVQELLAKKDRVIVALKEDVLELKDKLKERKQDQILMLIFRDLITGFATRGLFDTTTLGKAGGQKEVERLIVHAAGLAEIALSMIKGRLI